MNKKLNLRQVLLSSLTAMPLTIKDWIDSPLIPSIFKYEFVMTNHVDYNDDDAVKNAVKQAAGVAAGAAAVALAPVELPLVAAAVVTAGVGYAAAKTVGAVWEWIFD